MIGQFEFSDGQRLLLWCNYFCNPIINILEKIIQSSNNSIYLFVCIFLHILYHCTDPFAQAFTCCRHIFHFVWIKVTIRYVSTELIHEKFKKLFAAHEKKVYIAHFSRIRFIVATGILSLSNVFRFSKNFKSLNIFNDALQ